MSYKCYFITFIDTSLEWNINYCVDEKLIFLNTFTEQNVNNKSPIKNKNKLSTKWYYYAINIKQALYLVLGSIKYILWFLL